MKSGNGKQPAEELAIADAVVSTAGLRGRLEGVRRVTVRRGAVITPAVRDLLREKKVELAYQTDASAAGSGKTPLAIGVANTRFKSAELLRVLQSEPIVIRSLTPSGLIDLVEELTKEVATGMTLGLVLTEEMAATLCLANRQNGVRAASAANRREAIDAVRSIGANLLVVNPIGRSLFEMKSLVAEFCRGWPRACPEFWRGRM